MKRYGIRQLKFELSDQFLSGGDMLKQNREVEFRMRYCTYLEGSGGTRWTVAEEMISRLKCNFLRNQEDIYEYIICLLILKS